MLIASNKWLHSEHMLFVLDAGLNLAIRHYFLLNVPSLSVVEVGRECRACRKHSLGSGVHHRYSLTSAAVGTVQPDRQCPCSLVPKEKKILCTLGLC